MGMATRHARSIPAVLLIVAGALTVVGGIAPAIPMQSGNWFLWTYLLACVAIAVAFVLLAQSFTHRLGRVWLYLAAAGWAVYGLSTAAGIIPLFTFLGAIIAIVFGIMGAVVTYRQRFFTARASTMFMVSAIIGAVFLLVPITLMALAFGASLIVTGVFMQQRR
jgi:hypothetical protein